MPATPIEPQDVTTLVPNQACLDLRLASVFRARNGDTEAIRAPAIQRFSSWAQELERRAGFLRGEYVPLVPGVFLVQRLWEQEIARDGPDWLPAERRALAAQSMEADRLLQQWTEPGREWGGGHSWQRFQRWRGRVHGRMAGSGWRTGEQQLAALRTRVVAGELPDGLLPRRIILDGFVELTRVETALVEALAQRGVEIVQAAIFEHGASATSRLRCDRADEELLLAAHWSRAQAAAGRGAVAVIVNGLDSLSDQVCRVFENVFEPEGLLGFGNRQSAAFYVREGMALAAHPLVAAGLRLIEWSQAGPRRQREFSEVSHWLLSPAWAGADTERSARAALEHRLRRRGVFRWSPLGVCALADGLELPELMARVTRWPGLERKNHPAAWFRRLLQHWGWPGPLPRDVRAGQAVQRFLQLLGDLERAENVGAPDALSILRQMCNGERLAIGGGALSPVQVIRPEDAWGCRFEAAWVVNLHAGNWPGPVRQNALLPAAVNRLIPRAQADGLLDYTRRLHRAILHSAPLVTCSWSAVQGGVPASGSPLLDPGQVEPGRLQAPTTLAGAAFPDLEGLDGFGDHPWLQASVAPNARPVPDDATTLRHVVQLLELQFACPFAAFLAHRLQAGFETPPTAFADASYAGLLMHKALERLYRPHLGSSTRPAAEEISHAVAAALEACGAGRRLPPLVLTVERHRLEGLLRDWLDAEARRRTGDPVLLEHPLEGELAGFRFEVRIDRVDRMPDGRGFVLDYKSGALPSVNWDTGRLTQPQTPLYAVLLSQHGEIPAGGIALASVRPGAIRLTGLSDAPELADAGIEGFAPAGAAARRLGSWEQALRQWTDALRDALAEYRRGECGYRVYFEAPLRYLGLELLLQRQRLQAWQEAQGGDME